MLDMDTQERHVLYVSRWLSVDEDDRQIVRELPVHTRTSPGFSLPGTTIATPADRSHGVLLLHSRHLGSSRASCSRSGVRVLGVRT